MFETLAWMTEEAHWIWWSAGVLLLAGEMILPGVYLLWIGLASALTGIVAWFMPGLGFEGHGLIFSVLAGLSVFVGHRYFYSKRREEPDSTVNTRGQRHIGKCYIVVEAIKNGRGHVTVGDSRWLAEGPDTAIGEKVRVIAVDGTVLMVEALED